MPIWTCEVGPTNRWTPTRPGPTFALTAISQSPSLEYVLKVSAEAAVAASAPASSDAASSAVPCISVTTSHDSIQLQSRARCAERAARPSFTPAGHPVQQPSPLGLHRLEQAPKQMGRAPRPLSAHSRAVRCRRVGRHPRHQKFIEDAQQDRPQEKADQSIRHSPADHAEKDDEHRRRQSACHQHRLQDIVDHRDDNQQQRQDQCRSGLLRRPSPDDDGQHYGQRSDLNNAEDQHEKGDYAGCRDTDQAQDETCEQGLKESDTDHAAGNVADGRAGQVNEVRSAICCDTAGKGLDNLRQPRAWNEEKACDQHRHGKPEHTEADTRDFADDRAGGLQEWRSEPLHRRFEIAGGEAPRRVDLLADHRPIPHRLRRPRHCDRLVLEVGNQLQGCVCNVDGQRPQRGDDDYEA